MRFVSILMALAVAVALYVVIIERDAFTEWVASRQPPAEETEAAEEDVAEAEPAPEDGAAISVVVRRSTAEVVASAVILRGQTEAARQVDVRAETTSTVVSEPLRKGIFIEEGQLLCELDPGTRPAVLAEARARVSEATARRAEASSRAPEAEARLTEAEARLDEALTNQNVARRLSEGGFAAETRVKNADATVAASMAAVEAARAGLSAAESGILSADASIESAAAGVASAEKEMERLQIRAPFAGLLESDTAELGSLLQAGGHCATVIQLDPIKLVAFVPETEVNKVEVGAQVGARLAAGGDIIGNVSFLSRSADTNTRTFRVEIEIPNPDLRIRDGQTVELAVRTEGTQAHLLPSSALTLNDEGTLGLRLVDEDDTVVFNPVTIINDTLEGTWLAGLPQTADVIVVGQDYVRAGVKVDPTLEEEVTQ